MTNTTRKLRVQKDILATTHHQDHSQYAKNSRGTYGFRYRLPLFEMGSETWIPASFFHPLEKSTLQSAQITQHGVLLCKPPLGQVYPISLRTVSTTTQKATPTYHLVRTAEMYHVSNCLSWEFNR